MSIGALSRFESVGEGTYTGRFDGSWNQGPGTFGGLLAATLGQCFERDTPDRPLRALSLHLCAPAEPGPLTVRTAKERQGTATTFASGRVEREGRPMVLATATMSRGRVEDADFDALPPPEIPPPDGLIALGSAPGVPVFTQHFDFRFAYGIPFTGQDTARSGGWLRLREPEALNTPVLLALLDTWPLAVLPTLRAPRPAASVVIHFQLFHPLPTGPTGWVQVHVECAVNRQGYSDQVSSVWDASGRLLGRCHQLVAVIR